MYKRQGKIAEYGKELGIPTPTCDILTKVVHCIQDNYANQYFQLSLIHI